MQALRLLRSIGGQPPRSSSAAADLTMNVVRKLVGRCTDVASLERLFVECEELGATDAFAASAGARVLALRPSDCAQWLQTDAYRKVA
eukprot:6190765-Pleurochrysis_carterae.AAC.1